MLTPQQEEIALFGAINQMNKDAHLLNKNIAPNEGIKNIPLNEEIYGKPQQQAPPPQPPHPVYQQPIQQVVPQHQPVQDLSPLIDRVTSLEKQVTRFVNLIERNVAKNAKEINIRIKLNENNDSTDSK
jgi:hypothetical protein